MLLANRAVPPIHVKQMQQLVWVADASQHATSYLRWKSVLVSFSLNRTASSQHRHLATSECSIQALAMHASAPEILLHS